MTSSNTKITSLGAKKNLTDESEPEANNGQRTFKLADYNLLYDKFPPGFRFGCGSSAVQIEGGSEQDGKGPSVWDALCRDNPELIDDGFNCSITCDSYNLYTEDVRLLKEMGANSYKFSISWPRVLPNGDLSTINQKGVDYYNNLIDLLIENGIEPLPVIWHWDTPEAIAKQYNWKNEELIDYFVNYSSFCFSTFGDRVKYWMTLNEPWGHICIGYDLGVHPPKLNEPESVYLVLHNLLKAHASAYRLYETQFKEQQKGKVGISLDCWGLIPADPTSPEDIESTRIAFEFKFGCIAHPLYFGYYPASMRVKIDKKSKEEGRAVSRLPEITPEWAKIMKGTIDFIGLNHYTCEVVAASKESVPEGVNLVAFSCSQTLGFCADEGSYHFHDPKWPVSPTWWLKVTPEALRPLLRMIKKEYGNPEVIVTENGYPDNPKKMEDIERSDYFKAYINEVLKAIKLDGCNVTGYMAWGLLDGWEWTTGVGDITFGVHHVDMKNPNRTRTPRLSAKTLKRIFKDNGFIKS